MKEVRNKRLVLAGLVVLALLLASTAAIAIFRETLRAVISAQTGNFDVDFVSASAQDNEQNVEIATCTATVHNADELRVQIGNAYPGYQCEVTATVRNTGTIHARFENFNVDPSSPALDVQVVQPPAGVIAPNANANVVFRVTVTDQAMENSQYSATLQLIFRQALP